jgi:hypothetical protein
MKATKRKPIEAVTLTCQQCSKEFQSKRKSQKFCKPQCRRIAWLERHYGKDVVQVHLRVWDAVEQKLGLLIGEIQQLCQSAREGK